METDTLKQNKIKVYWIANNPNAIELRNKLHKEGISFEEYDVSLNASDAVEMMTKTGQNSYPMIIHQDRQWIVGPSFSFESMVNELKTQG